MATLKATIIDPIGFHARPATLAVTEASKFESDITIKSGDKSGNMKSIMNVMALGIKNGADIEVVAEGSDADEAIKVIEKVLKDNEII